MSTSDTHDVSNEITPLDVVIRDYLLRIDRGEVVSHQELLASHPDLQDDLRAFLEGVAIVQRMAGAPSALADTCPPTKFETKYATVATPEGSSSEISKTSHSKSASDLTGPFPFMLGQYRILKNIGQGAMGAVYVADDIRLGRKVALKVPLAAVAERPDHLDRFTREARASAQLRHHNICPVYEVNEQDGIQYIAMAYIEGQPLLEVLRKNRRFSGKQMAVTIRKIALALDVAHRAGIVHRDLKPANIMIDKDGEPIVMDFGLARQIHSVDQAQLTQEGAILGTPAYMSPEQVRSELQRIGPASDIYSLGVILYELLCGSHPFRGPLMTVLMNVADNNLQPPKPSEVRASCDPQLEAICLRMISKRITDRYPSMKDVAAALSNYIKTGKTAPEVPTTELPVKHADTGPVAPPAETPTPLPTIEPLTTESAGANKPPRRRMRVILGGLFAAVLAGVIIITITTQDGQKTVLKVPEGTEIDIPAAPGAKVSIAVAKESEPPAVAKSKSGWRGSPAAAPPAAIAPLDGKQADPKRQLAFTQPGFDEWVKEVAALPVEGQVTAVAKKLQELNPGFDGKVTHTIANDKVVLLNFISDHVTDLSPLRALRDLQTLYCNSSGVGKSQLADLSPLQGLPLHSLDISYTAVVDLSQLSGLRLSYLVFANTAIADLTPLKGMPLSKLNFNMTQVSDLTPLQGMSLTMLGFNGAKVTDLLPLRGMKLTNLQFGNTAITDLSPLEGMPLSFLQCINVQASDLTPLRGIPLTSLNCGGLPVKDLSPLEGMKLSQLYADRTQISDLSPLAGMPLEDLRLEQTQVSDLSPLKGAPLLVLQCHNTLVDDLSPVAGRPLRVLTCSNTKVTELSILKGMPLETLWCDGNAISDLSPLQDLPLKDVRLDFLPARDTELLKSIKTLQTINSKPAAEFWKEVEAN